MIRLKLNEYKILVQALYGNQPPNPKRRNHLRWSRDLVDKTESVILVEP